MMEEAKEPAVADGIVDNKTQIMQVCDRLCNFFLKNKLQEKSPEQMTEAEKSEKRSRLSAPVVWTRSGLDEEIAETANLDNCFQVCIDNLDAADQEQETDMRVFDDAKRTSSMEKDEVHDGVSSSRASEVDENPHERTNTSMASAHRKRGTDSGSAIGGSRSTMGSVLCSQFTMGKLSLVAEKPLMSISGSARDVF